MATRAWMMLNLALWYLARGTGIVTLVLLTIVVVLGIGSRSGRPVFGLPRFAVATVHRDASLLALLLLGVHVSTLLADPFAQLRLVSLVVPFTNAYRPLWVGLGALALDLIVVLVATSLLRRRIAPAVWRAVHWLAYLAWPLALVHGLGAGTDHGQRWMLVVVLGCISAVLAALWWRTSERFSETASARTASMR